MAKMLIAARGWPGLAAAITAYRRGYDCRLIYEDAPSTGRLLGDSGPLSSWLSGMGISFEDSFFQKNIPSLLYTGERWELLGIYNVLTEAHLAEKNRFYHDLKPIDTPLFQKVRNDLSQSFERAEHYHSFAGKTLGWFRSPVRKAKRLLLKHKVLKNIHSIFDWEPLFFALESAMGFSEKDCLTVQRIVLSLFLGQLHHVNEAALFEKLLSDATRLGIRVEKAGSAPIEIQKEGGRGFIDSQTNERFDRVLDLSSSCHPRGGERMEIRIPCLLYPELWPDMILIPGGGSQKPFFLEVLDKQEQDLVAKVHFSGPSESVLSKLSDLFHSEPGEMVVGKIPEDARPILSLEGRSPHFRRSGPYAFRDGTFSLLTDPSMLPFFGEDWVVSLYESLPNLKKT